MAYGTVKNWHNDEGWLVISPHGGSVAGPGEFLGHDDVTWSWSFEPVEAEADGERVEVPTALLNGVMDHYADLLAFVSVTLGQRGHAEFSRHETAFLRASDLVRAAVPPEGYGPCAPGLDALA